MSSIGGRIRTLRKTQRMSQDDLAEKSGLHRSTINAIENNRTRPGLSAFVSIAEALQTSTDYLLNPEKFQEQETVAIKKGKA